MVVAAQESFFGCGVDAVVRGDEICRSDRCSCCPFVAAVGADEELDVAGRDSVEGAVGAGGEDVEIGAAVERDG